RPFSDFLEGWEDSESICCPFHNDNHPSAGVFKSFNGEVIFNCFSCDVETMNIIGMYQKTNLITYRKAIKKLAKILGIRIQESEFVYDQLEKYRLNRYFLI